MENIALLIKPASSLCNMRCRYCFYFDIAENRSCESFGFMKLDTLEKIVKKSLYLAERSCNFTFQGGEPSLVGLDFYRQLIEFINIYNTKKVDVHLAIQTNGYSLDDEWCAFFKQHNFLVGLSLDGTRAYHNLYRFNAKKEESFSRIWSSVQCLQKHEVSFNILTVVTADIANNIEKIYFFYRNKNLLYQQYIPCLDPFGEERGQEIYSLTPKLYAKFLCKLFDLWFKDVSSNKFIYIQYFENLLGMLKCQAPDLCGMLGVCSKQLVLEADASVYPCDFYVYDEFKLGNFIHDDIEIIEENRSKLEFITKSYKVDPACKTCPYLNICRGGCKRHRQISPSAELELNYFCPAYKQFFKYALPRLQWLADQIH